MNTSESLAPEDTFQLREYLSILGARKWSITAITLLGVLAAFFVTERQTPIYASRVQVIATDPLAQIENRQTAPDMGVEQSLVYSLPVAQCATKLLETPTVADINADLTETCSAEALSDVVPPAGFRKDLAVVLQPDSTVMEITYSDPVPAKAQANAQAFALSYVHYRVSQATIQLNSRIAALQTQLTKKGGLNAQRAAAEQQQAECLASGDANCLAVAIQELNNIDQQIQTIQLQLFELSPTRLSRPQVVAPATLPPSPSSPNTVLNIAAGFFVALALGVGLAFLRERLDDRLRGRGDLEDKAGVPVMAVIPTVPRWKKKEETRLVAQEEPKSAVSEAYRTLRTSILFSSAQRGLKTIMVTSAVAGEGKTTTAANLAVVLADAKKRVILVSADLRKPRVHKFFGLKNDVGLANVLAGEVPPWEALRDQGIENLRILPGGPIPARPAELLQSERMGEVMAQLREVADFVVLDSAPVLLVADATAVAPLVDGVLLVADSDTTTRGMIAHVREQLEQVDAPLIGAVFNNFDPSKPGAYRYRYGYGYGYRYRYGYQYGGNGAPYGDGEALRKEPLLRSRRDRRLA
jgi:capsular exopolysaccharide synthesis family protein